MENPFDTIDWAKLQQAMDETAARTAATNAESLRRVDIMRIQSGLGRRILTSLDRNTQRELIPEMSTVNSLVDQVVRAKEAEPELTDVAFHHSLTEAAQLENADPQVVKMAEVSGKLLLPGETPDAPSAYLFDTTIA